MTDVRSDSPQWQGRTYPRAQWACAEIWEIQVNTSDPRAREILEQAIGAAMDALGAYTAATLFDPTGDGCMSWEKE